MLRPYKGRGNCGLLALRIGRWGGVALDGSDYEGVAEDVGWARVIHGNGAGADDWGCGCFGACEDGVDLRDGFAYLWVGPVVAGEDQAADYFGTRVLRCCGARRRRCYGGEGRGFCQRGDARELRALPPMPAWRSAHL